MTADDAMVDDEAADELPVGLDEAEPVMEADVHAEALMGDEPDGADPVLDAVDDENVVAAEFESDGPVEDDQAVVDVPVAAAVAVEEKGGGRPFARKRNGNKSDGSARKSSRGKKVVGLKIGASQIAAAVVIENDGVHELDPARPPADRERARRRR